MTIRPIDRWLWRLVSNWHGYFLLTLLLAFNVPLATAVALPASTIGVIAFAATVMAMLVLVVVVMMSRNRWLVWSAWCSDIDGRRARSVVSRLIDRDHRRASLAAEVVGGTRHRLEPLSAGERSGTVSSNGDHGKVI